MVQDYVKFPPLPATSPEERRVHQRVNRLTRRAFARLQHQHLDLRYQLPSPMVEDLPPRFLHLLEGSDHLSLSIVKTKPSLHKPHIIPIKNDLDSCLLKFELEEVMMRGKLEPIHAIQFQPLPNELLNVLSLLTDQSERGSTPHLNQCCEDYAPALFLNQPCFLMKKILI
ncbi:hypothetical protein FRX31_031698 [Thalictrum thalictroides]|uniref:Uncharacterized protein n=1 Tax=Thalictrum thalictroides TaxID=46969 RepID=A0A7J6V171_THATH|nr:hypothetical protein FRX31_031698 [Thalictrum thalictroides]